MKVSFVQLAEYLETELYLLLCMCGLFSVRIPRGEFCVGGGGRKCSKAFVGIMMALKNARGRLVADPSIGVSDLMTPIKTFMKAQGDRDLLTALSIPSGTSWKTAVNVEWMAHLAPLYKGYAAVAVNTILPGKKHKKALEEIHSTTPVHVSKKADRDMFDYLDEMIRIGFSHYRTLAQSPEARSRAYRKASPSQVEQIDGVLKLLQVGDSSEAVEGATPSPKPAAEPMEKPIDKPIQAAGKVEPDSVYPRTPRTMEEASQLFQQIMAQDDVEDGTTSRAPGTPPAKLRRGVQLSPSHFELLLEAGDVDDEEEASLRSAAEVIPIGINGEAQLTIFKKNGGKSSKDKVSKAEGKTKKIKKAEKKPSAQDSTAKATNRKKTTKAKKAKKEDPNEAPEAENEDKPALPDDAEEPLAKRLRGKTSLTASEKPDDKPEGQDDTVENRSKKRHRAVSKAYHLAFKENKHLGKDTAKIEARKAHQLAGEKFDAENPRV